MKDKGKRNGIIAAVLAGILGVLVAAGIIAPEQAESLLETLQQFISPETAETPE